MGDSSNGDESEGNLDKQPTPLPEWTTPMDAEILEVMSLGLILTPAVIADNIDRSREGVSKRLNALEAGGLVQKIERGKYQITKMGLGYLGDHAMGDSDFWDV